MSFLPVQRVLDTAIQSRFLDTNAKKVVGVGLVLTALHVASALAAVVYNHRRGLYRYDLPSEYKPTTPFKYAIKDLGAYLMLSQLINKVSSLFKTPPQLEIRAVSWNLSDVNGLRGALGDRRALGNEATEEEYKTRYEEASIAHMNKIIHGFGPDIILMQQLAGDTNDNRLEHTPLLDLLRKNGYRIHAPWNAPAIAFKEKVFSWESSPDTLRKGSACIELTHKATGQRTLAVSDHLTDLNIEVLSDGSISMQHRTGDKELKNILRPLIQNSDQGDVLVIYGLNSNTTPPLNHDSGDLALHPDRLYPLRDCNFVRDTAFDTKEHATTVERQLNKPVKFDHIFCRYSRKALTVARQIITNINAPQLLEDQNLFRETGSDHLPVAAIIKLGEDT